MGASAWIYREPFADNVPNTLTAMVIRVLTSGDYLWPWEGVDEGFLDEDDLVARPRTLDELGAARDNEDFFEFGGTHTIMDMRGARRANDGDSFGQTRELGENELVAAFGTTTPTREDFDRVCGDDPLAALGAYSGPRWTARCMTLFDRDRPSEVIAWGWSGD